MSLFLLPGEISKYSLVVWEPSKKATEFVVLVTQNFYIKLRKIKHFQKKMRSVQQRDDESDTQGS